MTPQSDDHNAEEGDDHQLISGLTTCVDTTLTPPRAQYCATRGKPEKGNRLDMRDLQARANPCNA